MARPRAGMGSLPQTLLAETSQASPDSRKVGLPLNGAIFHLLPKKTSLVQGQVGVFQGEDTLHIYSVLHTLPDHPAVHTDFYGGELQNRMSMNESPQGVCRKLRRLTAVLQEKT